MAGFDLRHLALILDEGRQAAELAGDAALASTLNAMMETAVNLELESDGELFNVDLNFTLLAERLR